MLVFRCATAVLLMALSCSCLIGCGVATAPPPPPAAAVDSGSKATNPEENVIPVSDAIVNQWVGLVLDAEKAIEKPADGVIAEQKTFEELWSSCRQAETPPQADFASHLH